MTPTRLPALAKLLQSLRGDRYSLRDVERLTSGLVSNVYLSQLETAKRTDPHPRILVALARAYEVSPTLLFEAAGYVDAPAPSAIDTAYAQVLADRSFKFGTRVKGAVNDETKRFIIELYERATGKSLLNNSAQKRAHEPGPSSSSR